MMQLPNSARYGSPARMASAQKYFGTYRFTGILFPVYSPEEVTEYRKSADHQLDGAEAIVSVYAFPPVERPFARFLEGGETPRTGSKAILDEIERAQLLNILIVIARFGSGFPRQALLMQAYAAVAREMIDNCGRAPLTRRSAE